MEIILPNSYASDVIEVEQSLPLPSSLVLKSQISSQPKNNQLEAITLYLSILHEEGKNSWAPYQLASTLAIQGQREVAERYLKLSSQRGFWYYYNLLENPAFNNMHDSPVFQQVLAETKERYQQQAQRYEAKYYYIAPAGEAPKDGWPVIVYLHNFGDSARINSDKKAFYQQLGYVYIEINGTQMLSENTFRWSQNNAGSTQRAVQYSLEDVAQKIPLNRQNVYLVGQGQGGLHAANLLAQYPWNYAGGMIISPQGKIPAEVQTDARGKRIVLITINGQEKPSQYYLNNFKRIFTRYNQIHEGRYANNTMPWNEHFYQPLMWLLGENSTPIPPEVYNEP